MGERPAEASGTEYRAFYPAASVHWADQEEAERCRVKPLIIDRVLCVPQKSSRDIWTIVLVSGSFCVIAVQTPWNLL